MIITDWDENAEFTVTVTCGKDTQTKQVTPEDNYPLLSLYSYDAVSADPMFITTTPQTNISVSYAITDKGKYIMESYVATHNRFVLDGILNKGELSITFTDKKIKADSIVDIYTDIIGDYPKSLDVTDGIIQAFFGAWDKDIHVKMIVTNTTGFGLIRKRSDFITKDDLNTSVHILENNITELNNKIPNITISPLEPTESDGEDGDIWIVYEEQE